MSLPRFTSFSGSSDMRSLAAKLSEFARDVINFLRALPEFELRTLTTVADFPQTIAFSTVRKPRAVLAARVYQTSDPSTALTPGNVHWAISDDPNKPGIVLRSMSGLSAGTEYSLTLLVVG